MPTRHGTHWPHDSSRKKAAIRVSWSTRSTCRSCTITTPEPERQPGGAGASSVEHQVEVVGAGEAARRAAEQHGLQFGAGAHAAGQRDQLAERDAELDLVDAGPATAPDTQNSAARSAVVRAAKAAPPPDTIPATLASVSTLLTSVGLPNRPTSNGNGGLLRGSPR